MPGEAIGLALDQGGAVAGAGALEVALRIREELRAVEGPDGPADPMVGGPDA